MSARRSLLIAAALALTGCTTPATVVIVTVDAEPGVRDDSARLHVVILGGIGRTTAPTASRFDRELTTDPADPAYPFKFVLAPLDGDVGRSYSVTATAETEMGAFVGQARIIGGYVEGETLTVHLVLEDMCRRVMCSDEQTCKAGICVAARVGGDVDAGVVDAGAEDAGGEDGGGDDAGTRDAGMSDAGMDDASLDMGALDSGRDDGGVGDSGLSDAGRCADGGCVDVAELAVGSVHTCARLTDGTVRCWGSNTSGQLGDGSTTERHTPVAVSGLSGVVEIAAGFSHSCARLTDGTVRCWGQNATGEVGDGTITDRLTPVAVSGISGAVELGLGAGSSCARLADGTVWCWGTNTSGEVGDGTTISPRLAAAAVLGVSGALELATYANHSCARVGGGTVRCWGLNNSGELGDGTRANVRATPVISALSGLTGVVELAVGYYHSGARLTDGTVRCVGQAADGELGDGTTTTFSFSPIAAAGVTGAVELALGNSYSCARLVGGTVRCWGNNSSGQLGDGTLTNRLTSVEVSGLTGAIELASGASSSCARLSDGTVRCWGYNIYGQLGDGTTSSSRSTPVEVVW